jgi:hypothetical protein
MIVACDNPSFPDRDTVNGIAKKQQQAPAERGLWLYCSVTVHRHAMFNESEAVCHWQPRPRRVGGGAKDPYDFSDGILRSFAGPVYAMTNHYPAGEAPQAEFRISSFEFRI